MKYQLWKIGVPDSLDVAALREAGYSRLLAGVLVHRGIVTPENAAAVLERKDTLTISPLLMRDMNRAVQRVEQAVQNCETVAVFGDYDVDGITSTVILTDYLRRRGVNCLRYIPCRIEEGYGLSETAVHSLHEQGVTLIITVDCGITGNKEVDYAASLGMDVIVTDHHECKDTLPNAFAVVDPHRPDCPYPFKHLAGCGVALKLVMACGGEKEHDSLFERYCTLAAIGTVADVMRMEGENRTIVSRGLELLAQTPFPGIHALIQETGLGGKAVTSTQIGFVLSPRINAAGRMGQVNLAVELLETQDTLQAEELAKALCALNRKRQEVEQEIFSDAVARMESLPLNQRAALVLASDQWHQGVIGIVASRLSEKYARPCFMIYLHDGIGKGSCRSGPGFNLFAALESCAGLLDQFGGHELAAGFTIREENLDEFRVRINDYIRRAAGTERPVSSLDVDLALSPPVDVTLEEVTALERLEPYGTGNAKPVFALLGCRLESMQSVGQGRHLKIRLSKGTVQFDAIFFSVTPENVDVCPGMRVDAAFYLQPNTFRGVTTVQLQLLDLRPSRTPGRHETEALSLLQRVLGGESLTAQQARALNPSREQFAACWKAVRRTIRVQAAQNFAAEPRPQTAEVDTLPYLRWLSAQTGGTETFLRAAFALEIFRERGLLSLERAPETMRITCEPVPEKVDLTACPYLLHLREYL